jgi:hypothetical protein
MATDGCVVNTKTIGVPLDWHVDGGLLNGMVVARRAEPGAWQRLGLVFDPHAPCDLSPS